MAKKHKNHIGGFEAPRNSLELPAESFQSRYTVRECEPYSYVVRQNMPKSSSFSANAPMKKLISDEISRGSNHKQRGPSIVARLMGMDVFPSDTELMNEPFELKDDSPGISCVQKQNREKISNGYAHKKSSWDKNLHSSDKHMYTHLLNNGANMGKPRHRLHPQEKELQQFKKDFEAWQASRFLECAKVVELENIPDMWLAKLDQTKEKMAAYENAKKAAREKAESLARDALKPRTSSGRDQHYYRSYKKSSFSPKHKNPYSFRSKSMDKEFEELSMMDFDKRSDRSSTPARIVILKPGPENFSSNDESWASSSGSVDERDCIEDLLEEVKERLRSELQGKTFKRGSMIRGGGIETPFKERPTHPNQRARDLRMQVRENITGDLAKKLLRSESTRSYRSEVHPNSDSPEFTKQDVKQLITCSLRGTSFDDTRGRLEQVRNILNATNEWNHWDDSNHGDHIRHEFSEEETFEEGLSPRNLVRSLSAPVPGTSFGKLLLEDRHILTGAQVRRKHEALESAGMDGKDRKKERFKLREKVSNIRYNFTLKGKLFSRKFHSFDLSQENEYDLMKDVNSGPTVLMNLTDRNENYTEVPPSPASVCSSTPEELSKPADHPSSASTSDITSLEDQSVSNALREISSNLNELRRDLDRIDLEDSEVTEEELENMEDESEAYIRDLLVASGLYNGSMKTSLSNLDPFEELINDWVFAKVEGATSKDQNDEASFHRKMLFDLLNEALTIVLKPPKTQSRFRRSITSTPLSRPPHGKTLLQKVWKIIQQHLYQQDNTFPSLEEMVSDDLDFAPWVNLIDEELKVVGSEMEARITSELIEEFVKEIQAATLSMMS